jgi:hypothetical protein
MGRPWTEDEIEAERELRKGFVLAESSDRRAQSRKFVSMYPETITVDDMVRYNRLTKHQMDALIVIRNVKAGR